MNPSTLSLYQRYQDPNRLGPLTNSELELLKDRLHDMIEFIRTTNPATFGLISIHQNVQMVIDARGMDRTAGGGGS